MLRLEKSLRAWPSHEFSEVVRQELEQLDAAVLPLQQGITQGSYVRDDKLQVMIINVAEDTDVILVKAGVFYSSVIAGCNCADDPTPIDSIPEYCVIQLRIDKNTADTEIEMVVV